MPIISLSVSEALEKDLDSFSKKSKLSKSELARAALSRYIDSNYRALLNPKESYTLSLAVICSENHKHDIHEILHTTNVRSQFHLCLGNSRCIETFGLTASGKDLIEVITKLEQLPKLEKIQLCIDK